MAKTAPAPMQLLHGTGPGRDSGGRKVATVSPGVEREVPDKPADLPAEAAAEWDRVTAVLDEIEVLGGNMHRAALIQYVRTWAHYVELERAIAANGRTQIVTVRDSAGGSTRKRVRAPEWDMLRDCRADLRKYAADFGLNPAAEAAAHAAATTLAMKDTSDNPFAG
ncbi:P27 family phage terminase small subunit [Williamsia muralis]|uniref:P27 family phage terminase small subunit n=1 Tax=Williamsia marianensis TaxID=85044 RepID=A0ABU4EVU6_WILMA|nr:P27 family phage terminase small subunit [Williamsia muralis]MDV7135378.1 P27 family phage terminase small subunit [Williamsia muralis]